MLPIKPSLEKNGIYVRGGGGNPIDKYRNFVYNKSGKRIYPINYDFKGV